MNNVIYLDNILESLMNGDLSVINDQSKEVINNVTIGILNDKFNMSIAEKIIMISNILYENTDMDILPLEDGIYDLLLEKYKSLYPDFQIGAPRIHFDTTNIETNIDREIHPILILDSEMLFKEELGISYPRYIQTECINPISVLIKDEYEYITKRNTDTPHEYPELVGTLNKCKFVLTKEAEEKGVVSDSNIKIVERDFFQRHIESGILDPNRIFTIVAELKYDGISVEGEISSNKILSARTRGDVNEGVAADITPIVGGYVFKNALGYIPDETTFGMKFEAIMTTYNLLEFNRLKERDYKNCRTAIIGLMSSSDAYKYKHLLTLVPLATSMNIDRLTEIEFMNKYYSNDEKLRYAIIHGNYQQVLFQIKRFVDEAELMRPYLPFMYDGVVISYIEDDLIQALGRKNHVNQYSMAIKFNPLKKQTIFRGYTYTIGQDGSITPMINYDPVEFYGTIHNKSTGHSYDRFKSLSLKIGDIIDVEYVNDVMPYVTKPDNSHNSNNPNKIEQFIKICPSCGSLLVESDTGKTVYCNNIDCPERNIIRMVNMLQKLNIKDFAEANLKEINKYTLHELLEIDMNYLNTTNLGEKTKELFMSRINDIKTTSIEDYKLVGSLGFTNIAKSNWKTILSNYTIMDLIMMSDIELFTNLTNIKSIGSSKATVIINEMDYFKDDLLYIANMPNVINIKDNPICGKKIKITGFRDPILMDTLESMGHTVDDSGVTKDTDILLIPYDGHTSRKIDKAKSYDILIIPVKEFVSDMDKYLM